MSGRKEKIEMLLETLSRRIYRNPLKPLLTVFVFLYLIGVMVSQVPSVSIDTTSEALLHKDFKSFME
jgi:hypothetical protein